jgi:hypothetical protein
LQPLMDANAAVSCAQDGSAITCTAAAAGTPFVIDSSTSNRPAVAQISTLTPNNVEIGDTFTGIINGTSYEFTATAATVANVVEGLQPLMDANAAVSCAQDGSAITCTAAAAGTPFVIDSSTSNRPATAQVVYFTPSGVALNETFNAVLNGTTYSYQATTATVKAVVEGLQTLMDAAAGITCSEDDAKIVCTADVAGTAFTYSASVTAAPSSGGGGGGGFFASPACANVQYGEWQDCINGIQYRDILSKSPANCALSSSEEALRQKICQLPTTEVESNGIIDHDHEEELAEADGGTRGQDSQIEQIMSEAEIITQSGLDLAIIINYNQSEKNSDGQLRSMAKYTDPISRGMNLSEAQKYAINNFILYGTVGTKKLGAGERAGVVNSYKTAFGKVPANADEWSDALKIAIGRWPGARSAEAENKAKSIFKTIYLRSANMDNARDNAAVTVMSYGLRPFNRNLDSEKAAINIFKAIFKKNPTETTDWDAIRAIAYSGATR